MDVADWLRALGLGQYERSFHENDVDAEVLVNLTADDLIGLGITSIGHRRKLLAALASLRDAHAPLISPSTASPSASSRPTSPLPGAERRHLTVMFADLVGSTAIAAEMDPEDVSEILRAYRQAVAGAIVRFDGHVAKYMGDGVLAYFGYPQAHEDDPERAVRSGLAAVAAVESLAPTDGRTLKVRIGIATGPVIVGELVGDGAAREEAVVGETPNLAARLQTLAEPGAVVIGPRTRQLIGAFFDLSDLGSHSLKGFPGVTRAWQVLGEGSAESRFDALHGAQVTPLVGREHELGLLLERWERAKDGDGQVVLLIGEPGIGKSRLIRSLRQRLESEAHVSVSHYCTPHHQTSPLYPVINLFERSARLAAADASEVKLEKLESLLARSTEAVSEVAPVIADLLSIRTNGRYPPLHMSPHQRKERTLEVLVDQLLGLAAHDPVLAAYEDVHWADPTSLELLDIVVDRVHQVPILVVITCRTEFVAPWTRRGHVTSLTLGRLSRRQGAAMVERVTGKALPNSIVDQIVAKTDGIPLFLEEFTRSLLEADLLRDAGDHNSLSGPLPSMAIPTSLQALLTARLDRSASAREVAQVGAVIGREFSYELLASAAFLSEDALKAGLNDLVEAGLIFCRSTLPQATYSFKHALVRDAAYATLVKSKRQQLHACVASAIEQHAPEAVQTQPELLAHHYIEAGSNEAAINYLLRAGQVEIARSATAEAITQLSKGLDLASILPDGRARWELELELQIALGVALMTRLGWAASEVGRANARARELCERLGDTTRLFPVLYGEWVFHVVRADLESGRRAGEELLRLAQKQNDPAAETVGNRIVGTAEFLRGELPDARTHLERALALYDQSSHRSLAFLFAQDPRVAGLSVLSWTLFALGYPAQARTKSNEALGDAQELRHGNTLGYALLYGCILAQLYGDWREAKSRADRLVALATEQGAPHFLAAGRIVQGWELSRGGEPQAGALQIHDGIAAWQSTGAGFLVPYYLSLSAEIAVQCGRANESLELLDRALARVNETGEEWLAAELHRLKGEALLTLLERNLAKASFEAAAAVARKQSARLWELRATTSLARLLVSESSNAEANALLAPVYRWFVEGFETSDLQSARAILNELQPSQ